MTAEQRVKAEKQQEDQHLGDGVYVSHDSHQLWLAANHHTNRTVAMGERELQGLVDYARRRLGFRIRTTEET